MSEAGRVGNMVTPDTDQLPETRSNQRVFATTRWTVVLQAGGASSEGSAQALEQLCRTYWYPIYSFARRRGLSRHDAEDMTQGFFAHLLERDAIGRASQARGRFRTFLLKSFVNFQANEHEKAVALKRGGGRPIIHFEALDAETRYQHEPATNLSPERIFDQKWATALLDQVMQNLRRDYAAAGKAEWFDRLKTVLWGGPGAIGYAQIAAALGRTEGAVKVGVHRLRARYREALLLEVANTLTRGEDVEDELRHLLAAVSP